MAPAGEHAQAHQVRTLHGDLIERGGFGSPTLFVGQSMFFGNDRLPLVRAAWEAGEVA